MQKLAVIDIGSNSIRMLIASISGGIISDKKKYINTIRIADGLDAKGILSQNKIDEAKTALFDFVKIAKDIGVENIITFATSAIRDSINKKDFTTQVYDFAGIKVKILSGIEEAEIGFIGAISELYKLKNKNFLVIDVGGSSTELILGNNTQIIKSKSFQIGAVRYLNEFFKFKQISETEDSESDYDKNFKKAELCGLKNATLDLDIKLKDYIYMLKRERIDNVILIAGTACSIAMNDLNINNYEVGKINSHRLNIAKLRQFYNLLLITKHSERAKITGVESKRGEIILQGTLIIKYIIEELGINEFIISDADNLEGSIIKNMNLIDLTRKVKEKN